MGLPSRRPTNERYRFSSGIVPRLSRTVPVERLAYVVEYTVDGEYFTADVGDGCVRTSEMLHGLLTEQYPDCAIYVMSVSRLPLDIS